VKFSRTPLVFSPSLLEEIKKTLFFSDGALMTLLINELLLLLSLLRDDDVSLLSPFNPAEIEVLTVHTHNYKLEALSDFSFYREMRPCK